MANPQKFRYTLGYKGGLWIPVEFGLPSKTEVVLVSTKDGRIDIGCVFDEKEFGGVRGNEKLSIHSNEELVQGFYPGSEVVAWSYLPECYIPENSTENDIYRNGFSIWEYND